MLREKDGRENVAQNIVRGRVVVVLDEHCVIHKKILRIR